MRTRMISDEYKNWGRHFQVFPKTSRLIFPNISKVLQLMASFVIHISTYDDFLYTPNGNNVVIEKCKKNK